MDRDPELAPEAWPAARRVAERVLRPLERFLHVEAASGILLLAAAVVAVIWANSPWAESYARLWHMPVTLGLGPLLSRETLHFWINDGLMAIFFLVVGLEIRREIHEGELSELKRAALPVAAALGGMAAPAGIYLLFNADPVTHVGWGVPTATDIAFAVGVLALLGKRVPPALRVLLLALAIIDDIGAIVVIALFYSSGIAWSGLLVAAAGLLLVVLLQRLGVRRVMVYVPAGAVVWFGVLEAGVHPTIAGVVLGLLTPVRPWSREPLPPGARLEAALHPWVAFVIMPLFALANAGVSLGDVAIADTATRNVAIGVMAGLVLGKPIGILLISFVTVRLGICALPRGVGWRGVMVVGAVAGIGFTMAIFIAGLAFPNPALLGAAKLGVLCASVLAACLGALAGVFVLPRRFDRGAAQSDQEAESSTQG
ncbi:MAG TPA: Na+/H+ antiporter NhaA [Polyangiaceae bacterium]|nr:Na+/H+ antiporter NhaA [Polyangiaceae bacterium]